MFNISKLLDKYIVYIPEIQRDYAQGRDNAANVRNKLLDDIYNVLQNKRKQHVLNYIYGVPKNDGRIVLIDGQQRITTLFLLKWYLAVKSDADIGFLTKLKYATRDSSGEFCEFLVKHGKCIKTDEVPSALIENHTKFKKRWLNDPTIANMLNMLDAIDNRTNDNPKDLYENIDNIKFSFISLDGFKRTDELYAAMNSRGKQLTPFELIKGELLKADSSLAAIINGEWLPAFWDLSKAYVKDTEEGVTDPEEYASKNHDAFLFNYYSFVVQMIWWSESSKATNMNKGDILPSISEVTTEIIGDASSSELIKYAMKLTETDFSGKYHFEELERNNDKNTLSNSHVILFDGRPTDSVDLFKLCCYGGKDFTQADRCYLWAYIRYRYDKDNDRIIDDRTLTDYYVLMRSLFMRSASNETPTSVDKLSLNEELVGRVIIPFEKIIIKNPDYKTWSQYNAFFSDYPRKNEILNNPLLRGVTDNIAVLTDDKLADNLLWLWQTDSLKCFIRLSSCGFSNLKCEVSGYYDRVFIPFTKKMLQSLFSLRGWSKSQDFNNLVQYLRQNKLEEQADKSYVFCDWEYYMITYSSFRTGVYGQFELPDETQRMSFDATYIENERATKNKIRKPFLYEIYQQRHTGYISYQDYVEETGISFERNSTGDFVWNYRGVSYKFAATNDCIAMLLSKI